MIIVTSDEFKMIQKVLDKKHLTRDEKGDETFTVNVKGRRCNKKYAIREDKYKMYLSFMHKYYTIRNEAGELVNGYGISLEEQKRKHYSNNKNNKNKKK